MKSKPIISPLPLQGLNFFTIGRRLRWVAAITLLATAAAQAQFVTPDSGLAGWWQAEGNANDSADSNHGSLLNGGTYAPGVFGSAFSLDGANDHVRVPNSGNLQFTTAMTAAAWVRTDSYNRWNPIIVKWDAIPIGQRSFAFGINPEGRAYFGVSRDGTDAGATSALSTGSVPLNTWTHLAGSYDGSFVRFYVNGLLESEKPHSGNIFVGTDDLAIGGVVGGVGAGSSAYNFRGLIDEAVVYSRSLSSGEILALATIPEPSAAGLLLLGLGGFFFKSRARRS